MKQYLDLLKDVLDNGTVRDDRTGVGTIAVFGRQIRFNMADGFPAVTTKALAFRAMCSELLWFLEGSTNEHRLAEIKNDNKPYAELTEKERRTIWTANYENQGKALGYTDGEMGRIYPAQYRGFRGITEAKDETFNGHNAYYQNSRNTWYHLIKVDQVNNVINEIKKYIIVPDSYKVNNKGIKPTSLGDDGSLSDAYAETYIKRIFKMNDTKYDSYKDKNYSDE